jgi:hypothetical protein
MMAIPHRLDRFKLSECSLSGADGKLPDESYVHSDADVLVCTLSGRGFYKRTAGWAVIAYMYSSAGYTGPMIVSPTAANVIMYTTYNYQDQTYAGTVTYNGTTYYYCSTGQWISGNQTDSSGSGHIKLTATAYAAAATELLDRYFRNNGY